MRLPFLRFRPLLRALQGIHRELTRMNDIREMEIAHTGLHFRPAVADTSGKEPEVTYTNEEADYFEELALEMGKTGRRDPVDAD